MSAYIRNKVSKIINNQFPFYETPASLTFERDEFVIPNTAIINNLYVKNLHGGGGGGGAHVITGTFTINGGPLTVNGDSVLNGPVSITSGDAASVNVTDNISLVSANGNIEILGSDLNGGTPTGDASLTLEGDAGVMVQSYAAPLELSCDLGGIDCSINLGMLIDGSYDPGSIYIGAKSNFMVLVTEIGKRLDLVGDDSNISLNVNGAGDPAPGCIEIVAPNTYITGDVSFNGQQAGLRRNSIYYPDVESGNAYSLVTGQSGLVIRIGGNNFGAGQTINLPSTPSPPAAEIAGCKFTFVMISTATQFDTYTILATGGAQLGGTVTNGNVAVNSGIGIQSIIFGTEIKIYESVTLTAFNADGSIEWFITGGGRTEAAADGFSFV